MKKFLLFIVAFITMLGGVSAQKATWGVKAELNLSTFVGNADKSNNKVGYGIGVLTDLPINKTISIAPELKYVNIGSLEDTDETTTPINCNYIALPIMLRCHLNKTVALEIGPQFAYLATAKTDISNVTVDVTTKCHRFDASIGAGLLLEYEKVFFSGRYNYSFTHFVRDLNAFHSVGAIGFGIKF